MSSFIGHTLAALTIGATNQGKTPFRNKWLWNALLICAALVPDIDYAVAALNAPHNGGRRITHSILFALLFPACIALLLLIFDRPNLRRGAAAITLAGLSHLFLDMLVASRQADPYFYPFSDARFVLPFGLLPSAGKISLTNYYFYRNLLIEAGILIPLACFALSFAGKLKLSKKIRIVLLTTAALFLIWSLTLNR